MIGKVLLLVVAAVSGLAVSGCKEDDRRTLTVFAASSLTDAFRALEEAFERANPDVRLRFHFAGSQELARQLSEGAAADLIATADRETMAALAERGLVQQPVEFTSNLIVVATREGLRGVERAEDLSRSGLRIVMAAPDVPAGRYARQVIEAAGTDLGGGWKDAVLANVVGDEPSVRAVLERVRRGEADAGFVYRSDLTALGRDVALGLVPFPARLALAPVYPAALTARPAELVLAQAFLDFLLSEEGQAILASFGFGSSQ